MTPDAGATGDQFGHPAGLRTLFFTEMWERMSYYGMRALLVLFMVDAIEDGGLGFTDASATATARWCAIRRRCRSRSGKWTRSTTYPTRAGRTLRIPIRFLPWK